VQLLKDIVNPSFLALEPAERFLYSAHGDAMSDRVPDRRAVGRLNVLNRQPTGGKNG